MPYDTFAPETRVSKGTCLAMYAYDVAPYIDLQRCESLVSAVTHRQKITKRRRALEYFEYRPAPLVMSLEDAPREIGGFRTAANVEVVVYDFGAVTLIFSVPFTGSLDELVELSIAIDESDELQAAARKTVAGLLDLLRDDPRAAVAGIVEDYVIFHVEALEGDVRPDELPARYANQIARILRAERESPSEQEALEAVSFRIGFGASDMAIIDWNATVLYGREIDDLRTVIEFANVQLLELRFLDRQLDAALEDSYAIVSHRGGGWWMSLQSYRRNVRKIAELQVDGAILFERVSNALKVFGEEYLSRVYALTAERLHLSAWDASALRKLRTLESIYEKLTDETAARRLEILEWIIVLLIALSILLPFLH